MQNIRWASSIIFFEMSRIKQFKTQFNKTYLFIQFIIILKCDRILGQTQESAHEF